eukprot:UC1_evm8s1611
MFTAATNMHEALSKKCAEETGYNCLNPEEGEDNHFVRDQAEYMAEIASFDRHMATVALQAWAQDGTLEGHLKIFVGLQGLTDRPMVHAEVQSAYPLMLGLFETDLDLCKERLDLQRAQPRLARNMPDTAGRIQVAAEMSGRIKHFMSRFEEYLEAELETPSGKRVQIKYAQMLELLAGFEKDTYASWAADVDEKANVNLDRPLLVRDAETGAVAVNFDDQLVSVLREVHYISSLAEDGATNENIPARAAQMFAENEKFRALLGNLTIAVTEYNRIQDTLLDVEEPLIEGELVAVDARLAQGIEKLNWKSESSSEYGKEIKEVIEDLSNRLLKSKANVTTMLKDMATWYETPALVRDHKTGLFDINARTKKLEPTVAKLRKSSESFAMLCEENRGLFKAAAEATSWLEYVQYLDSLVLDGLFNTVHIGMAYFLDHMDKEATENPDGSAVRPLFEGKMSLVQPEIVFAPGVKDSDPRPTLADQTTSIADDFFALGREIKRLAAHTGKSDYTSDLVASEDLSHMRLELQHKTDLCIDALLDHESALLVQYEKMWTADMKGLLAEFLKYGHELTPDEIENMADEPVPEEPATLQQIKEKIDSYNDIAAKVKALDDSVVVNQWYRMDVRMFKSELHNVVKKWALMFINHLKDGITEKLTDLDQFISTCKVGLEDEVPEGDYDALVKCMALLNEVDSRAVETNNMFGPLNETVAVLANFGVEIDPAVAKLLENLPEQWNNVKKQASAKQSDVGPLKEAEQAKLKRKANQFDVKNFEFREDFKARAPQRFEDTNVYARINKHYREYVEMAVEMDALSESSTLLNVTLPDYKATRTCHKELRLLKVLWDLICLIKSEFEQWKTTRWTEIDSEGMEFACKSMIKEIRNLDKDTRAFEAFNGADALVKNMVTSLGSVALLQSPAIRDRHWTQLMDATGVKIVMDTDTTLADLLALNLHNFEDEVAGIVDKASKEQNMEKTLVDLDATWKDMNFEYGEHSRTGTALVRAGEELVETLEDNQVQVQNLMASKYIGHFLEQVSSWQKKLSTADSVLEIWLVVQRTWGYLEAIFIGSEDIREQLPEDSQRFDGIDVDFKEIMGDAKGTPNVVEATNKEGLFDKLEDIQKRLSLCEKALQEYLETKRLAFPRFYFVASADLLDILSQGNNPAEVAKQLSKLFCVLCDVKLGGGSGKEASAFKSLDGEWVDFRTKVECSGRVEDWLNKVLDGMQDTVRQNITDALITYEEKKRDAWVFDNAAQVSLVGTQVWWATEVNLAFARLEEGFESAMKDYNRKQVSNLNDLIVHLQGKLSKAHRVMLQTICTVDVHSRDVVLNLIAHKADNADHFQWISQLRHIWDDQHKHVRIQICDARFTYSYEYLGNMPRLVITPLTDRCYITLTQSLHLVMSGAPAGPAGTGKTETTKDLSRNIGIMIYVFNCSEQMDYMSVGNIFKGLAQTGAWGCFDEFNRILVSVLSVVAVQVKCIQTAIKDKKKQFDFLGDVIKLNPTIGIYITMNPGYAGRAELPENLKVLFRPCAMVVPDYGMICEIMLVSEGFLTAKLLARKFITLYTLNRDLLSKQDHYDWGLRAIKSVLVVAGSLKRADPDRSEEEVLMRALRDFNIPKIVNEDVSVFMGLIIDLFPGINVPRKRDEKFETICKQSIKDLGLQYEDAFLLKIVQLQELLEVRHSVFIIGAAATGKSCVLKALFNSYKIEKKKPVWACLNPKAVTNHELYGYINLATRDWVDGLFSTIMRDISNLEYEAPKWIVLDGDIDTMWIESLNTVMDDNKVLTLASNERIALKPDMRALFEIANLTYASPATVSRAGILFVNPTDLGWQPVVQSWVDKVDNTALATALPALFERYIPPCFEAHITRFKTITPVTEWAMVNSLMKMMDLVMTPKNLPDGCSKDDLEWYFVFCAVWAFGGAMFKDQLVDWRESFSKWWISEFKAVKFPSNGSVFDYFIKREEDGHLKWHNWSEVVPSYTYDPELPLQAAVVPTSETVRLRYWMDLMIRANVPVLLCGFPGTGKTALALDALNNLPEDEWQVATTAFNHYTIHHMMQEVLEAPLEKKAGKNFGPQGMKSLVYFVDDLNMPEVDIYGTASPHTIMRQHIDHDMWYDRVKLQQKCVSKTQYMAAMNPKAGSFTINPRLQRHFTVFAVSSASSEALTTIYSTLFNGNVEYKEFPKSTLKVADALVQTAINMHMDVTAQFLPTAIKFHYLFNLRDLSKVFQGMTFASPADFKTPISMARLLMHEIQRVYSDKFVTKEDSDAFELLIRKHFGAAFPDMEQEALFAEPRIHCHFADGIGDPKYAASKGYDDLKSLLNEALSNYNEVNAAMNLVLFRDAMNHVCRINRILESPGGNALLVGVGGSGKQSLSRLSASISNLDTFQITLAKGYGINELKADLANCFIKAGKGQGVMFLMTDAQVSDEKFLVLINDLLASGKINGLFDEDQTNEILDALRAEVKGAGIVDTNANIMQFFYDRVSKLLKVVLCFSPVGDLLRIRARRFPAVINCTSIDWFHEWPEEALVSVSRSFLEEVEVLPADLKDPISEFMSFVHTSVNEQSQVYLEKDKRYNYTTPKSFLEQIALYQSLVGAKFQQLQQGMDRMENGVAKLKSTGAVVDDLKDKLAAQEIELAQKNKEADELIEVVGVETEKVNKEKAVADVEQKKVDVLVKEVGVKAKSCEEDLAKAEPALIAAQQALDTLNKNNLTELKSFGAPPDAVVMVTGGVMCLLAKGKPPKDKSWKAAKGMMGNVGEFLDNLVNYDKENIGAQQLKAVRPILANPDFDPDFIRGKSLAAAGLCAWCINIVTFYDIYCDVEPKRKALAAANAQLEAAQTKLAKIMAKIKKLDGELKVLTDKFEAATAAKLKCQQEADETNKTINLANRLVGGLSSEKTRWSQAVLDFKAQEVTLPGDVLLVTAFISYTGCFTKPYRDRLYEQLWVPFIKKMSTPIPITEDLDPLTILATAADIAGWQNESLPADRVSTENATILTNAKRWPLIIDPQEQGIKWIKDREGESLQVVRLGQKGYLDKIERGVRNGDCVLIENIFEEVDPVLDNILGRQTIKKGRAIMMGDKEVDYSKDFRLILHTKMANPHYKPEMQAQCTLINFTVTLLGLEDQLLAGVVGAERPDLQAKKAELTRQQNEFMVTLKELEDNLLAKLSAAGGDFLKDEALVLGLENTKSTAEDINQQVAAAKITEADINVTRELYRPAAARASLLFFVIVELYSVHPMYQVSLQAFNTVFFKAIEQAPHPEEKDDVKQRVEMIRDTLTYSLYTYTSRGLFEADKLIFASQMAFQIMRQRGEMAAVELDFLLRAPIAPNSVSPVDFVSNDQWGMIKSLSAMEAFTGFDRDIEGSAKRWKKYCEAEVPEQEAFPGDWKSKSPMQQLCMMRTLRPDRMLYAVRIFVGNSLGQQYVGGRATDFATTFAETSSSTGVFFILSPGVDPIKPVEALGKKMGVSYDDNNYYRISLGQGQEIVAERALDEAAEKGGWVVMDNIHLVVKWLKPLEKKLEECMAKAHKDFRFFMTAEPSADHAYHVIPQGILQICIKVTNEPPAGVRDNMHAALDNFDQDTLESCAKEVEFRKILFAMVYFHAVMVQRRKFGASGWNCNYPFNTGDLTISVDVLYSYLENNSTVPWTDLRYLFGEIFYGGHITDNLDRRLCATYLVEYLKPLMLEADLELSPGFLLPDSMDYTEYHEYIDDSLPSESPYLYGMHPNAEIEFLTATAGRLFRVVLELQPKDSGGAEEDGNSGPSQQEIIQGLIDDFLEKMPEEFNMYEFAQRMPVEERTPYTVVAFQETARMNKLTGEIRRSLKELTLGLKGELTITEAMETLQLCLFLNRVPPRWESRAYPSTKALGAWYADLLERCKMLDSWSTDFALPSTAWLGGLFNPQSFLTAILQQTARKNEWPLDKMWLSCDVTKKFNRDDFSAPPREGAYVWGLFMEGARWDTGTGMIQEARLKELTPQMPVLMLRGIPIDKRDTRGTYECPTFKTKERGRAREQVAVGCCPGFVWSLNLKTKLNPNKWTLAGVCMLLSD